MATRSSKLKAVAAKNILPEPIPQPVAISIKRGRVTTTIFNSSLAEMVPRAYRLQREVRALEPEIKDLKTSILLEVEPHLDGSGTLTIITGGVSCKVTCGFEYYINEADIAPLREALGERFHDLVKVKTIFTPERKLVDLCCQGDTPDEIRETVQIKSKSPVFVFGEEDI